MDMPTIRIDDDVWAYLQGKAKAFVDTPNDVLRRELGLDRPAEPILSGERVRSRARGNLIPNDKGYSYHRVRGYKLDGKEYPAQSFKEVLIGLSNELRREHSQGFDKVATELYGKKRVYFSLDANDLRQPHRLSDSDLFVETNLNADLVVAICRTLVETLGHDFEIEADAPAWWSRIEPSAESDAPASLADSGEQSG